MPSQSVPFRASKTNPQDPTVTDVEPREVWEKKAQVVIIDVRGPDEFSGELGHIPGAILMPLNTLPLQMEELPSEKTIVFVCKSGGRSARAAAFARQNGITDLYNMEGGMILWNQLGLTVEGRSEK